MNYLMIKMVLCNMGLYRSTHSLNLIFIIKTGARMNALTWTWLSFGRLSPVSIKVMKLFFLSLWRRMCTD